MEIAPAAPRHMPTTARRSRRAHLGITIAAVTIVRVALWATGTRFQLQPYAALQLLDIRELAAHPFVAFTDNHIQPPLWNFFVGAVYRWSPLPTALSFQIAFFAASIVTVIALWLLLAHLAAPRWAATTASITVGVSPLMIFSERTLAYEIPITMLLTLAAWSGARYLARPSPKHFALFAAFLVAGALTRATLTPFWVIGSLVFVLVARRPPKPLWRTLVPGLVALAVLGAPMIHNRIRFGTTSLSSYSGMNWEHATVLQLPAHELRQLIAQGRLSPAAAVQPFAQYRFYAPHFPLCHPDTGKPVLDEFVKTNGEPNMNNICYLPIDRQTQRDAWATVRADPGKYLIGVGRSTLLFSSWGVQDAWVGRGSLRDWTNWYDPITLPVHIGYDWGFGDPQQPYVKVWHILIGGNSFSLTVAAALLASLGLGVRGALRWIRRRATTVDLIRCLLAGTVVAVMIPSVLFDAFENARYRQPLDPILLGPFLVIVLAGGNRWVGEPLRRRRSTRRAGSDDAATTPEAAQT